MSLLAAPLTIITARDQAGRPWGFTASSVTSASLDPPLVLVGLAHTSSCFTALTKASEFAINILGSDQSALARRFATSGTDRFAGARTQNWPDSLLPHLTEAPVVIRCGMANRITVGDHDLLVGELIGMRRQGEPKPLLWYRREFHSID
ncbi:flavin reductase family protein (plasmid) [Streptomyces jietaisiensis]|uniref:flavin reductase family protein n=1 Tax=Streptomyces griseoaurantiacus TaxID=68213 RepID=UPI00324B6C5C